MIEWSKIWDRVYCISYLPNSQRREELSPELARVGLLNNPIFEWRYTVPFKLDEVIHKSQECKIDQLAYVNLALENLRIMKISLLLGHKRILVLEDDVRFLQNIALMEEIIKAMPMHYNVHQFDKFIAKKVRAKWEGKCRSEARINKFYIDREGILLRGAGMVSYDKKGMEWFIQKQETLLRAQDEVDVSGVSICVSTPSLCIQHIYDDAKNLHYMKKNDLDTLTAGSNKEHGGNKIYSC